MPSAEIMLDQHAVSHQILADLSHVGDHCLEEVFLLLLVVVVIRIVPDEVDCLGKVLLIHFLAVHHRTAHRAKHPQHASYVLMLFNHEGDALVHAFSFNT